MKARTPQGTAVFGPEQLSLLYKAFDDAWDIVKSQCGSEPQSIEVARLRLANAVLSVYRDGVTDAAVLTDAAVHLMQRWL